MLTDAQGNVKERHDYAPFGDELLAGVGGRTTAQGYLNPDTQPGVNVLFTGQYRDWELASSGMASGLDYFRARHHAPALGRFMQPDPLNIGAVGAYPQTWHAYNYVANNPLVNTDPFGLFRPAGGCVAPTPPPTPPPPSIDPCWLFPSLCWAPGRGEQAEAPPPPLPPPSQNPTLPTNQGLWHAAVFAIAAPLLGGAYGANGTVGVGLGGSAGVLAGLGGSVAIGVQAVADPKGGLGIAITLNPGFVGFGASAMGGGQASVSTSKSIFGLKGWSLAGDVSVGAGPAIDVGISRSFASWTGPAQWGPTTLTTTVGRGAGTRAAVGSVGYTFVPKALSTYCGKP